MRFSVPSSSRALCLGVLGVLSGSGMALAQTMDLSGPPGVIGRYASGIFTAEPDHTEGAPTLLLPVGPRAIAMARAVSTFRGPESVFWNPAGLAEMDGGSFFVYRSNHLVGDATGFSLVLARQPLGALGISYQLFELGGQDLTDGEGNVVGSFSVRDHLAIASFGVQVIPGLDTGVNFKVFQSRYTCRGQCTDGGVTGTTYALDAGLQAQPVPEIPFRVGVLLAHLGPKLQLINAEQADPLPTRLRASAAYEVLRHMTEVPDLELWLVAEMEDRWRDLGDPVLYLGGELTAGGEDQVFVRAGYGQQELGRGAGVSVGLGVQYDRFDLGVAKRLSTTRVDGSPEPLHIAFGVLF